ncbi:hypothetical protein QR680_011790 [Steinernema hermaphroditum]|uniref:Uncharacterized protein n=1 Tax=Steinernema hermaphroditum TaxID=289476 RepID=A0AA39I2E0_9BILA|nr:hypothetical protein QR680_011790 [Steinernema hermaphroditum]
MYTFGSAGGRCDDHSASAKPRVFSNAYCNRTPESQPRYDTKGSLLDNIMKYRNHEVLTLNDLAKNNPFEVSCDQGEQMCMCDKEFVHCNKPNLKGGNLGVRLECSNDGNCDVEGYLYDEKLGSAHYISCNKCPNEFDVDTSPPQKVILPTLEEQEKLPPIGTCDPPENVIHKLQIDYTDEVYNFVQAPHVKRCRYSVGDIIYYARKEDDGPNEGLIFGTGSCFSTADNKHFLAEGSIFVQQMCTDGNNTLAKVVKTEH